MRVKTYSDTSNIGAYKKIVFKRPCDIGMTEFSGYVFPYQAGSDRLRIELISHEYSSTSFILGNKENPRCKPVREYSLLTHTHFWAMKLLFEGAKRCTKRIALPCDEVFQSCTICSSTGRLIHKKQIKPTYLNKRINQED